MIHLRRGRQKRGPPAGRGFADAVALRVRLGALQEDEMDDTDRITGDEAGARKGTEGIIFDLARKAVGTSVKSLLSTEEGLRALVGAMVPKEVGQYVRGELSQLRKDFLEALVDEMTHFLNRVDPAAEIQKVLSGLTFDVHVTVGVSKKRMPGDAAEAPSVPPARKRAAKPSRKAGKARA